MKPSIEDMSLQVADLILSFREESTGLLQTGPKDAITGSWLNHDCDPDDVGDSLIFVVWLGVLVNKREYVSRVREIMEITCFSLQDKYGFFHSWDFAHGPVPRHRYPIRTSYQLDILLGLNRLYILTKDDFYLERGIKLANALIDFAQSRHGYFFDMIHPQLRLVLPHKLVKAHGNGTIGEEFFILSEISGQKKFMDESIRMFDYWINTRQFKSTGFFSGGDLPFPNYMVKPLSLMVKNNSNMLFGLLEAYRQTRESRYLEAVIHGLSSIARLQTAEGGFPKAFNINRKEVTIPEIELDQNFNLLDLFLETSRITHDTSYLEIAQRGFNFWLNLLDSDTGLISEGPAGQKVEISKELPLLNRGGKESNICKIDQASDMSVEFCKFGELTHNEQYINKSIQLLESIWKYHKSTHSIAQVTNSRTGAVVTSTNITKYIGGYLKGLVSALVLKKGQSLLKDKTNWLMCMDR